MDFNVGCFGKISSLLTPTLRYLLIARLRCLRCGKRFTALVS